MANSDAPFGFRPNINLAGGTPNRSGGYNIAYDYATALFSGDLVQSVGDGRSIQKAPDGTAVVRMLGVFAGCNYVDDAGDIKWLPYWPGVALADSAKVVEAFVMDDPAAEFIAQVTTIAAADVGGVFELDQTTNAGSPVTGRSAGYIDLAATTNPQFRITGLAPGIDGISLSEYGAFAKVRCQILVHERASGTLATAI